MIPPPSATSTSPNAPLASPNTFSSPSAINPLKTPFYTSEKRAALLRQQAPPNTEILIWDGLIRGLRSPSELDFELDLAAANHSLAKLETLFLPSHYPRISSTIERNILQYRNH